MDEKLIGTLQSCSLCRDMTREQIEKLLKSSNSRVREYDKGEFIFHEGDRPEKLFILISGRIGLSKDTLAGKRIAIMNIEHASEMFGEVYLFMEKENYDLQAEALEKSEVLSLSNYLFKHNEEMDPEVSDKLQYNMMSIFAMKAFVMNKKIKVLASASAREKIVRFLFERQDASGRVQGNLAREDMADYMNITRPSLSRELGNMQEEGILQIKGREIMITDQEAFESYM